jgi:hypothetical protein
MRYLRIGHVTVFFSPFLAIIALLLFPWFFRFYNSDWLSPIMIQTEANVSIIGVQMFGLILCLLGIKKGEHIPLNLKALDILLTLFGAFAIWWGLGWYGELLAWSRLPGVRNLTIWDHMEHATFVTAGLLWIASGIILYMKVAYEGSTESKRKRFLVDPRLKM